MYAHGPTTTVFLRPGAPPSHANGVDFFGLHRQAPLDPHLVLPPAAEVVFIQESLVNPEFEVAEVNLAGI